MFIEYSQVMIPLSWHALANENDQAWPFVMAEQKL